ncbi:MAG: hypothetical protein ABSC32_02235 [Steroidobacteraceae bacterium]|jgi:hypothetical protein
MSISPKAILSFAAVACLEIVGLAGPRWSGAQTPAATPAPDTSVSHASAQSEAGEPRAVTSPSIPAADPDVPRAERRSQAATAGGKAEAAGKEGAAKGETAGKGAGKSAAVDKLELQTATVTGDREQPKVMYIVPWKKSDIGDLSGKPMNSLLDEALAPVDRDEFKREVVYYHAVRADASKNGAAASGASAPAAPR